jgi:hypothetical protein
LLTNPVHNLLSHVVPFNSYFRDVFLFIGTDSILIEW